MGLELKNCSANIKGKSLRGNLHVDSKELAFKSAELRWSVQVGKGTSAKNQDGDLVIRRGSKSATFQVGSKTDHWVDKVLNPPSLAKKLGLKAELRFLLRGKFDSGFEKLMEEEGLVPGRGPKSCEIAFVRLEKQMDLKKFSQVADGCTNGVHIWAVWPKGVEAISQTDVMKHAKSYGMGPGKKIAFDDVYTAMRFTKK